MTTSLRNLLHFNSRRNRLRLKTKEFGIIALATSAGQSEPVLETSQFGRERPLMFSEGPSAMTRHEMEGFGWGAGGDGASTMSGVVPTDHLDDDYDDLMGAWLAERGRVVETELLLARTRDILARLIAQGCRPADADRRKVRRLLREIDDQLDPVSRDEV